MESLIRGKGNAREIADLGNVRRIEILKQQMRRQQTQVSIAFTIPHA